MGSGSLLPPIYIYIAADADVDQQRPTESKSISSSAVGQSTVWDFKRPTQSGGEEARAKRRSRRFSKRQ